MGVLALLVTVLFTIGLFAAAILLLVIGREKLLKYVFAAGIAWYLFYGAALIGVSLSSSEKNLPVGATKEFCGFYLDCHMKASVTGVKRVREYKGRKAKGEFNIVDVQISSDARSAKLGLHSPEFAVVVEDGYEYQPIAELSTPTSKLGKKIEPDESLTGTLVFDLPETQLRPRLDVKNTDPFEGIVEKFVIGDEDSILHKRTYLSIEDEGASSARQSQ